MPTYNDELMLKEPNDQCLEGEKRERLAPAATFYMLLKWFCLVPSGEISMICRFQFPPKIHIPLWIVDYRNSLELIEFCFYPHLTLLSEKTSGMIFFPWLFLFIISPVSYNRLKTGKVQFLNNFCRRYDEVQVSILENNF